MTDDIEVGVGNGDILLEPPKELVFWLDAKTRNGEVKTLLNGQANRARSDVVCAIGKEPSVKVELRAASGDI